MAKQKQAPEEAVRAESPSIEPAAPVTFAQAAAPDPEQQIRLRAYQLYEERGRQDGFAEADWLRAEAEILNRVGRDAA